MVKNYKRVLLLFGVLLAITMSGCGDTPATSGNEVYEENKYENSKQVLFFKEGEFQFNIVRPTDMSEAETSIIKNTIFRTARNINEKRPNYLTDTDDLNTGLHNIFIGNTNQDESDEASALIKKRDSHYYDFIIMMKNGDIFIQAASDTGLESACNYFCENILVDVSSTIPEDYMYHYQSDITSNLKINDVDITSYVIQASNNPSGMEYRGCEEVQAAVKALTDFELPIIWGEEGEYENKIIVKVEGSNPDAYSIGFQDGEFVIQGGHDYSLNAALHTFAMNLKNAEKTNTYNISEEYTYEGTYSASTLGTDGYKLIFADEFDGDKVDENYWDVSEYVTANNHRTPSAISVENGSLVITSKPGKLPDGTDGYITGELSGKNVNFSYGYFEIRAKLPRGAGNWASFWAVGKNTSDKPYRPEIDVFETFGTDTVVTSQLHSWWYSGKKIKGMYADEAQVAAGHAQHLTDSAVNVTGNLDGGSAYVKEDVKSLADDWHTYGCEWTPAYIKFYCDGFCYKTVDLKSRLKDAEYGYPVAEYFMFSSGCTANLMIGNLLGRTESYVKQIDETTELPSKYYVDYVHLYQMETLGTNGLNQE